MKFFTEKADSTSKEKELDIKTLLKLARQYIDDNNVKKAQQCCKKVLRKNSQNYMALVLLGKSYGRSDEAPLSFERAIEVKPDHALAWQGLAVYYEGKQQRCAKIKLLSIYDKILKLDIEEDYANKTLLKTGELGCMLNNNDAITTFIKFIKTQKNIRLLKTAKGQLLHLFNSQIMCKDEELQDAIEIFKSIDFKDLTADHSELIILGDLIFHYTDFVGAVEEIVALEVYPKSLAMKVWLCKLLCKIFIYQKSFFGLDLEKHIDNIVARVENTTYGTILVAIVFFRRSKYELAYQRCIKVIKQNFDFLEETEALFLLDCSKMTKNLLRTKNLCYYLMRKDHLKTQAFIAKINVILLSCYIEEKDYIKSLLHLRKIPIDKMDAVVITEFGSFFLELDVIHGATWEILDSTDYFNLFKAFQLIKNQQFSDAIMLLQSYDKHPVKFYYLGLTYWFMDLEEESFEHFLKAAEVIPHHPKVFYCLGIHYYRRKDDIEESRRCFEKSYSLCKTDINVIKMLSVIYIKLGLMDLEHDLLQAAFDISETREYWLCSRLGRLCLNKGVIDEALFYLWAAIDIHPHDVKVHELIGDIHYNKRDYDRAFIAYNTVIERSNDNVIFFKCLNRIGYIYSEKMLYNKAILIFDNILDIDPSNVAALKGLTENRTIFALKLVANNLYKDARIEMQSMFNRIVRSMSRGIKDLVYWLLYGDVLVFMTRLPNKYSFVTLQTAQGEITKERMDMYHMAIESYSNIIKFRDSSALFRCSLVYYEYYCETRNIILCRTSYNLAVLYMKANPNVWLIWDLLGKLCYHLGKCETAYYCFCKALNLCEDNNFKSWFDLGTFYLKLDKHQLPNYRYVDEQFDLSTFTPTWITEELSGPTFENSEIFDLNLSNVEYMDKFQFTELIPSHHSSSTQSKEPTFDSPIESLKIIPNATDIIEWYLCFEEESAWSCCSLANLQESKGLFIPALRYYDRAYAIAHHQLKEKVLSYKGRVLMKMHEYEDAVNVYTEMREKNLNDTCALASALYKMENYKKSYACYKNALNGLCENDEQRVGVLVAMANVKYRLNGLHHAVTLLRQALKIKCGEDQDFNFPFVRSFVFYKVDIQLVAHVMSAYLYKDMDKTLWWYYMGLNYLRRINKYAKITKACVKRAIRINTEYQRKGALYSLIITADLYAGNRRRALICCARALKLFPLQPELWATFILCINADKTGPNKASFLRVVIDRVRKTVNVSEHLDKWLTKVENESVNLPKYFQFSYKCNFISLYSKETKN